MLTLVLSQCLEGDCVVIIQIREQKCQRNNATGKGKQTGEEMRIREGRQYICQRQLERQLQMERIEKWWRIFDENIDTNEGDSEYCDLGRMLNG